MFPAVIVTHSVYLPLQSILYLPTIIIIIIIIIFLFLFFLNLHDTKKEVDPVVQTKLKCAAGLADLATGKYKAAAKNFLQASFDNFNYPEVSIIKHFSTYSTLEMLFSLL